MTEHIADLVQRGGAFEQARTHLAPEVVESEPVDPGARASRSPRSLDASDPLASLGAEDVGSGRQRVALGVVPAEGQDLRQAPVHRQHARLAGLGLVGRELDQHRASLVVEVDVLPLEAQELAHAAPCRQQSLEERPQVRARGSQKARLFSGLESSRAAVLLRQLDHGAVSTFKRRGLQEALIDRPVEQVPQDLQQAIDADLAALGQTTHRGASHARALCLGALLLDGLRGRTSRFPNGLDIRLRDLGDGLGGEQLRGAIGACDLNLPQLIQHRPLPRLGSGFAARHLDVAALIEIQDRGNRGTRRRAGREECYGLARAVAQELARADVLARLVTQRQRLGLAHHVVGQLPSVRVQREAILLARVVEAEMPGVRTLRPGRLRALTALLDSLARGPHRLPSACHRPSTPPYAAGHDRRLYVGSAACPHHLTPVPVVRAARHRSP